MEYTFCLCSYGFYCLDIKSIGYLLKKNPSPSYKDQERKKPEGVRE